LDGDALQSELSLNPGPTLGALILHLTTARAYGRVSSREQALDEARRWLHRPPSTSELSRHCD
jgi:tRNA nucleotidyltransferase (CCA-adding enzyme)